MAVKIAIDRKDLQLRRRLEAQATRWCEAGERSDLLLNPGLPLSEAEDLLARRRDELGIDVRRYVEGSSRQAQQQASRRLRHTWMVAAVLAFLAVVATGFGWYGLDRQREADRQRAAAETSAAEAKAQAAAAIRNDTISLASLSRLAAEAGAPADAVMLAIAAWPRPGDADRPQLMRTVTALGAALLVHRERLRLEGHGDVVNDAAFSSDGGRVVTASDDGTARLWDAATGQTLFVLGHGDVVHTAAFSPDGERVVTASDDGTARLWDAATGQTLFVIGHGESVFTATFSPDGGRVVTASADGTARLWDVSARMEGSAFDLACAELGNNTDTNALAARYGLGEIKPICGNHPPEPIDFEKLQ